MSDDELKLDEGTAAALAGIHQRAVSTLDEASGGRPSGDLGDGADEIDAIMQRLGDAADGIKTNHTGLANNVQSAARGIHRTDEGVRDGFGDPRGP